MDTDNHCTNGEEGMRPLRNWMNAGIGGACILFASAFMICLNVKALAFPSAASKPGPAPAKVVVDLSDQSITDDKLIVLLASGVIPLNVTELDLFWNQVSDISPLRPLTNLTELNLSNNQISDISPITALTSLTKLSLSSNKINDISPLSSLTNLTSLHLSEIQINDISPLRSLTNLTELDLFGNQISDISPLSSLTKLTELNLENNELITQQQIEDLKLTLPNCKIHVSIYED